MTEATIWRTGAVNMAFDTLAYMKRLEAGGIDRSGAEAHAER